MQNLFISAMRTVVPIVAGVVLSLAGRLGIPVDSEAAVLVVSAGLAAVYYGVFRGLEWVAERMAWHPLQVVAGVLVGWARPPAYERPVLMPVRMKMDRAAMEEDIDEFIRRLGAKLDEDGGGGGGGGVR